MVSIRPRRDLADIEQTVCKITSEQLGIPLHKLSLSDRLIEDLHCDSLELIELLMDLEDEFQVVIPNHPPNPTYKSVFTRTPFRLSNLAELIYLQQDGPLPTKKRFSYQPVATAESSSVPFTQLGGLWQNADTNQPLLEFLEADHGTSVYRRRSDGMRCMLIPKSPVEIGCNAQGESSDEYPMHTCELDAFMIDAEPVTTSAYCRFLNSIAPVAPGDCRAWFELDENDNRSKHALIFNSNERWQPVAGTEKLPMILVSWYGAHAYSLWANGQDWRGYQSTDSDYCFLPSEAQWEYAARGATYQEFPWGDTAATKTAMNYGQHVRGQTYTIDSLPLLAVNTVAGMSPFGLHHMAGNVWQWCRDWYTPDFYRTTNSTERNPVNRRVSNIRSERGGSWIGSAELCRSSYRRGRAPIARGRCLGFRCISSIPV